MLAAASAAASGSPTDPTSPNPTNASALRPGTRATYRSLLLKGLAPEEAANLTAFLCGIHVGAQHWKLTEVNRLLFFRELQHGGGFGADDGADGSAGG